MMLMWLIPILLLLAVVLPDSDTRTSKAWGLTALALILIPVLGGMFMMNGFGMHGYGGWGWMPGLAWILVIGGLITVVSVLFRRSAGPAAPHSEAEQVLRMRLAKGEISPAEYHLLREQLSK